MNSKFRLHISMQKSVKIDLAIFFDELSLLKDNTSECIQDFVGYFAKGEGEHYGGKLGGLRKTIAETNAI